MPVIADAVLTRNVGAGNAQWLFPQLAILLPPDERSAAEVRCHSEAKENNWTGCMYGAGRRLGDKRSQETLFEGAEDDARLRPVPDDFQPDVRELAVVRPDGVLLSHQHPAGHPRRQPQSSDVDRALLECSVQFRRPAGPGSGQSGITHALAAKP
ncbi:hypothetical protein ABZ835_32565 [Streptomyces sp. NPDC047461]|uniref:hypothetical protein n=1 Tax=Streptomyces sp. NPDC047461 TaxID=3155619 RepID=UPI0034022869